MSKLIKDNADREQAIVVGTGLVALAKLAGGEEPLHIGDFLDKCRNFAAVYVDRLMKAEEFEDV